MSQRKLSRPIFANRRNPNRRLRQPLSPPQNRNDEFGANRRTLPCKALEFNMPTILTDIEIRLLGSLVEKQVTTPEYYPLTLNALTLACNQKNNRHPVTAYAENEVAQAVESLRE